MFPATKPLRSLACLWIGRLLAGLLMAGTSAALSACGEDAGTGEGGLLRVAFSFGEVGENPGQFSYPRGMCLAPGDDVGIDGATILVVDKTARVQRFDAQTGKLIGWFQTPESTLGKPTGMKVGPHPADPDRPVLYVADTHYHRVLVYDLPVGDGPHEPLLSFGGFGTDLGGFVYPTDIALWTDEAGALTRVYVSEYGGNDRVTIFEPRVDDGSVRFEAVGMFGRFGTPGVDVVDGASGGAGVLVNRPQQLVADVVRGELLVGDAINHRVGRFTPDGDLIGWIGAAEGEVGEAGVLVYPYSLDVLADGSIMVCEFGAGRLTRLDRETGAVLGRFGEPGRDTGQLAQPWEIAVAGRTAWVLDSGNHRVVSFRAPRAGGLLDAEGRAVR